MVLDRAYSPLDAAWGSLNDRPSRQMLAEEFKDEIRTTWRHFRPSSPTADQHSEETCDDPSGDQAVGSVSIHTDDNVDQSQSFDTQNVDSLFFDAGLDGFRVPVSDCSPPCVTNSKFNVIGDATPTVGKVDLDWWNYFDSVLPEEVENDANHQELNGKKTYSSSPHINGVGSPSTATDSPFWKIPKSASLPNNDWLVTCRRPCSS